MDSAMENAKDDQPIPTHLPALAAAPRRGPFRGLAVAMLVLLAAGAGLGGWLLVHQQHPEAMADVAKDAQEYLRNHKVAPLTGSLQKLLAEAEQSPDKLTRTQDHRLLAERAPEFELADQEGKPWSLKDLLAGGPVVLVFYYGYHCNHCVSQLFDLNEDLPLFRELGSGSSNMARSAFRCCRTRATRWRSPTVSSLRLTTGRRKICCTAHLSSTATAWCSGSMSAIRHSAAIKRCSTSSPSWKDGCRR
jgi:hypothetical protein